MRAAAGRLAAQRHPNRYSAELVWFACVITLLIGCTGCATKFYPTRDFREGAFPEKTPAEILVLFDDDTPTCLNHREIGTIIYDWARDGIFTSESVALEGIVKKAASLGATGIYKLRRSEGGIVGMATGTEGVAVAAAAQEVGMQGVAFMCLDGTASMDTDTKEPTPAPIFKSHLGVVDSASKCVAICGKDRSDCQSGCGKSLKCRETCADNYRPCVEACRR